MRHVALLLECDGRLSTRWTYGALLFPHLMKAGWWVETARPEKTWELTDDVEIVVISGGETSVSSTAGWMPDRLDDLRRLLEEASSRSIPVLGVCLGAQMLATVLADPSVVVAADEMSVGVKEIDLAGDGTAVVPTFHYEHVRKELLDVPDVELLATSRSGTVEAFRWRDRVVGVQFHPDLSAETFPEVLRDNAPVLTEHGASVETAIADLDAHADEIRDGGWPVVRDLWPHLEPG